MANNIYLLPDPLPNAEVLTDLVSSDAVRIERIVSNGQTTPENEWFDQDLDEWVVLIQGEAALEYKGGEQVRLNAGDHVLIPAHVRHRVVFTSREPPCIWIAVFGDLV